MSLARAAMVIVALVGCQFDERGLWEPASGADARPAVDTPGPVDATPLPDVRVVDAATPCLDDDGDTYQVGAGCDEPLDCDDDDARAYPGQTEFFVTPRVSGGFDYNCDGIEEQLDSSVGHECMWDWFWCAGSGWLEVAPACGEEGTYRWCEPHWEECREQNEQTGLMPCR